MPGRSWPLGGSPDRRAARQLAGEYALGVFDAGWHPVIRDALAYWRRLPPVPNRSSRAVRTETAAFVSHVVGLVGAR